jgi:hypothetical protein
MTDYHPLIARAVDGLAKNTGEARRALYERARSALVAQLRSVEPALSESDITKERLALEEAIRKVESEAARKALTEPRAQPRTEPRFEPRPSQRQPAAEAKPRTQPDSGNEPRRERMNSTAADLPPAGQGDAPSPVPPPPPGNEPIREAAQAENPGATKQTARSRILSARTTSLSNDGVRGFRSVVKEADGLGAASAKAAQTARDTRDSYVPVSRQRPEPDYAEPPAVQERIEHRYDEEPHEAAEHDEHPLQSLEPGYDEVAEEPPMQAPRYARQPPSHDIEDDEEHYEEPRPPRSYGGLVKGLVLLLIVLGVVGAGWEFRPQLVGLYYAFRPSKPAPSPSTVQTPAPTQKLGGRVPEEQLPGQSPAAGGNTQQGPAVAQRAVLYEADPNDPQGKRFPGSVVWRTETVSPGPGLAPELVVRADISIPERHMNVTWSLRRNTDKALPASHTIEVMFNLPPDFPGGGIANVPGILMKDSEEVRGMPLAGLAVKVTNGFFLIGLNAADDDMQRNLQLLKERGWFDVLIVYNNNSRAILTMEKGPPGDRAFAEALKAWGQ